MRPGRTLAGVIGITVALGACATSAQAGTIEVETTADQYGAQASKCALREAIVAANTDTDFGGCNDSADPDTVALGPKRYVLERRGANEQDTETGDLDVTDDLKVIGQSAGKTIVDGDRKDRVFDTHTPVTLAISRLTVTRGEPPDFNGGGIAAEGDGLTLNRAVIRDNASAGGAGGVVARGLVTIKHTVIQGNRTTGGTAGGGLSLASGATAELVDLKVAGNKSASFGGGVTANSAAVVVRDSVIKGNRAAAGEGGGFSQASGSLEITGSVIKGNRAQQGGGGIHGLSTSIAVDETEILKNKASEGAGINLYTASSQLEVEETTVRGNRALLSGGGVKVADATANLENSTISGNSAAGDGGGLYVSGTANNAEVNLFNVTLADNLADSDDGGSGSGGGAFRADGVVWFRNSIIGDNRSLLPSAEADCDGGIVAEYTLIENDCPGLGSNNLVDTDPLLKPLRDNGGPTSTHALKGSSPALEAANPATPGSSADACLSTDQRGAPRPGGALCDMGAYERQP